MPLSDLGPPKMLGLDYVCSRVREQHTARNADSRIKAQLAGGPALTSYYGISLLLEGLRV